jgi:hypothetical protein
MLAVDVERPCHDPATPPADEGSLLEGPPRRPHGYECAYEGRSQGGQPGARGPLRSFADRWAVRLTTYKLDGTLVGTAVNLAVAADKAYLCTRRLGSSSGRHMIAESRSRRARSAGRLRDHPCARERDSWRVPRTSERRRFGLAVRAAGFQLEVAGVVAGDAMDEPHEDPLEHTMLRLDQQPGQGTPGSRGSGSPPRTSSTASSPSHTGCGVPTGPVRSDVSRQPRDSVGTWHQALETSRTRCFTAPSRAHA